MEGAVVPHGCRLPACLGTKQTQGGQLNRGKTIFLICVRRCWLAALVSPEASLLCFSLCLHTLSISLPSPHSSSVFVL